MPSGYRDPQSGSFLNQGFRAGWFARVRQTNLMFFWVSWDTQAAGQGPIQNEAGLAIRCMRDVTTSASSFDQSENGISIFPNPAQSFTTITFAEMDAVWHVSLTDMNGKVIYEQQTTAKTCEIKVGHLPKGVYTVTVNSDVFVENKKLLVYL